MGTKKGPILQKLAYSRISLSMRNTSLIMARYELCPIVTIHSLRYLLTIYYYLFTPYLLAMAIFMVPTPNPTRQTS